MFIGVPDLSDTHYMLQILTHLGAQVERASGTVSVTAEKIHSVAPYDVVRKMRASVCVLGPSLGRCKEATVALPGGCVIGDRPIDLHLTGFEALGAAVRVEGGDIKVFAPKLTGAVINMQSKFGPTVLGTDNVMMAAVLADGVTVIEGAAQEPEVVDLAKFLNKMGAKIEGAGRAGSLSKACLSCTAPNTGSSRTGLKREHFWLRVQLAGRESPSSEWNRSICAPSLMRWRVVAFHIEIDRTMRFPSCPMEMRARWS